MAAVPASAPSVQGPGKGAGKGPAKGKGGGPFSGPLYNPSETLTGKALNTAAGQIAGAQTKGPITELAKQRATQDAGNRQGQRTDFGYYMQLAQDAKNAVANEQQIGTGLNSTLAGIGGQSQAQIGQLGAQQQGGAVGRMAGLGLDGGATASLGAQTAQQQGVAAQNSQTFRQAGALQGANYGSTGDQIGAAVPLAGTSAISQLAKAGQLADEPINSKIAAEQALYGSDKATALGQLRTAERNYQIAQEGLGIKQQAVQTTANQDAAKNFLTQRGQNITRNNDQAKINALERGQNITAGNDSATQAWHRAELIAKQNKSGVLSQPDQNKLYGEVDQLQALMKAARGSGHAEAAIKTALQGGTYQKGLKSFPAPLIDAAWELLNGGTITPKTASQLRQAGLRGNNYRVVNPPKVNLAPVHAVVG